MGSPVRWRRVSRDCKVTNRCNHKEKLQYSRKWLPTQGIPVWRDNRNCERARKAVGCRWPRTINPPYTMGQTAHEMNAPDYLGISSDTLGASSQEPWSHLKLKYLKTSAAQEKLVVVVHILWRFLWARFTRESRNPDSSLAHPRSMASQIAQKTTQVSFQTEARQSNLDVEQIGNPTLLQQV